jgi:DNA-binding transcriptional LysR family regulator
MPQVDALEEHLGAILLNRSTRSVMLAGETHYTHAAPSRNWTRRTEA